MAKSELIAEVIRLDREANRMMRRPLFETWKGLNLTVPQLRSLFFISNSGSASPGKLAAALGVTPPNVTGIVDRLVEQGLVARSESREDRRVLLLQTTEKGEAIISEIRDWRTNTMRNVLERLSERDLQSLAHGFAALVKAARKVREEAQGSGEASSGDLIAPQSEASR